MKLILIFDKLILERHFTPGFGELRYYDKNWYLDTMYLYILHNLRKTTIDRPNNRFIQIGGRGRVMMIDVVRRPQLEVDGM